jgi:hypothetical protein
MTRQSTKARELALFRLFQEAFPSLPTGPLQQPVPPEPDIVLEAPGGRIGVELTELHPAGSLPRLVESEQAQITQCAHEHYITRGGPPVLVDVYWASTHITSRADRALATIIAETVLAAVPPEDGESILDDTSEATYRFARPEIERIWVFRPSGLPESFWGAPQSGSPISIGAAPIQWELDPNANKRARYRQPYVSCWIVLAVEGGGPST